MTTDKKLSNSLMMWIFVDKAGNRATITKVDYTYKTNKGKGKLITVIGEDLYIKWYYTNEYWKK